MARKRQRDDGDLVWSSEQGDLRKDPGADGSGGGRPGGARLGGARPGGGRQGRRGRGGARSAGVPAPAPAGTVIKVKRETSGRKGKTATTLSEIPLDEAETRALAKRLKQHCGVGGRSRGSTIELQGDHRDKVIAFLEAEGLKAVRAGG